LLCACTAKSPTAKYGIPDRDWNQLSKQEQQMIKQTNQSIDFSKIPKS
jgi:hypothetical protein